MADSWNRLARGLPKKASYFTILRDVMDIDRLTTPALYSERRPVSSGSDGRAVRSGTACSIRCPDPQREGRGRVSAFDRAGDRRAITEGARQNQTAISASKMMQPNDDVGMKGQIGLPHVDAADPSSRASATRGR
jgi:hypothetical protein